MIEIPRVVCVEKCRVLAGGTHTELIHVGFAEEDSACIRKFIYDGGVVLWNIVFENLRGARGANTARRDAVLHREGDACQWGNVLAFGDALIGFAGLFERKVIRDSDVGFDLRVHVADALKNRLSQFDAGDLFGYENVVCFADG